MDSIWLKQFLLCLAGGYIDRALQSDSITSRKIDLLKAAVCSGIVTAEGGLLRLPDGRKWSLLTLNREYITQLAIYFELIESGQFKAEDIRLEHEHLDIVVFKDNCPQIAIEVKKSEAEGARLIKKNHANVI